MNRKPVQMSFRILPELDEDPDVWGPDHDELRATPDEVDRGNQLGRTIGEPKDEEKK